MFNFLVVRIFFSNPVWMIHSNVVPKPVSQVGIKLSIGVEPVAWLNHLLRIASFLNFSLQNLHCREIIISTIEIIESPFI